MILEAFGAIDHSISRLREVDFAEHPRVFRVLEVAQVRRVALINSRLVLVLSGCGSVAHGETVVFGELETADVEYFIGRHNRFLARLQRE